MPTFEEAAEAFRQTNISRPSANRLSITPRAQNVQTRFTFNTPASAGAAQANSLTSAYQAAYEEAKAANESRYSQILDAYKTLQTDVESSLSGMGDAQRNRLREESTNALETALASMDPSLRGSTVGATMRTGAARNLSEQMAELDESLSSQALQYKTGLESARLGFMERRTDEYPDINTLLTLLQGLGQYPSSLSGIFG